MLDYSCPQRCCGCSLSTAQAYFLVQLSSSTASPLYSISVYPALGTGLMAKIQVDGYKCERCGHPWVPRDKTKEPTICPECKSPYFNKPRKERKEGATS